MNEPNHAGSRPATSLWQRLTGERRASSHRLHLANVAIETSRCANLIAEGSRIVDHLPSTTREVEILSVCDEGDELVRSLQATFNHLRAEAANTGYPRKRESWLWRWLLG